MANKRQIDRYISKLHHVFLEMSLHREQVWDRDTDVFMLGYLVPYLFIWVVIFVILGLFHSAISVTAICVLSTFMAMILFLFLALMKIRLKNWYNDLPPDQSLEPQKEKKKRFIHLEDGVPAEVIEEDEPFFSGKKKRQ